MTQLVSTEPGGPGERGEEATAGPGAPTADGTAATGRRARGARLGGDHTSLDQRLGALQLVRVGIVVLAVLAAATVPGQFGVTTGEVFGASLCYLTVCLVGQVLDRLWRGRASARLRPGRSRAPFQQMLLPVDSLYLAVLTVPSGGAQSDFIWLFAVQLIAVTILASPRTGVRLAMWDSALLVAITMLSLGGPVGRLLGVPHVYTPGAAAIAVPIGGFWAVALSTAYFSALSERELRRSKSQLDALTKMASEMGEALKRGCDASEIEAIALRSLLGPFAFRRGAVVWQGDGKITTARATARPGGIVVVEAPGSVAGPGASAVANRAFGDVEPILVRRVSPGSEPFIEQMLPGATNIVVVALGPGSARQGLLLAEWGPPLGRLVNRRALEMVSRFAAHVALALSNADLREEVSRLAASDSLTGLANRRALTAALTREVARAARTKRPLSIAVIDIDHFKRVNDTHGHPAGDEVLRAVAKVMLASVRDIDLVARYGGEEFAIVLPDCSSEGARAVVERVRAAVAALATVASVTLSAGIATTYGDQGDGESLTAAADEALYASKRAGRDRVTVASPPEPDLARQLGTGPSGSLGYGGSKAGGQVGGDLVARVPVPGP